ncbi:MAG: M23 family metallopeptidase [Sporomusaceae bacterium]|nr:M23 family metallopeptidase [Sporomusaceae bacterium]
MFQRWKKQLLHRDFERDYWPYGEEPSNYLWLKRTIVATMIFFCLYLVKLSNTEAGFFLLDGAKQILTVETDLTLLQSAVTPYITSTVAAMTGKDFAAAFRPIDPFQYMIFPVHGQLIASFGAPNKIASKGVIPASSQPASTGIVISAPQGTAVRAAAQGKISEVSGDMSGRQIVIRHSAELETIYAGMAEVLVKPQELVSQGQILGYLAPRDKQEGALFFEILVNGQPTDPLSRLVDKSR